MPTRFDPATGGIIFTPQEKDNEIIIKTADDFPATIESDKVYFIDKFIDMGDTELTVPTGGMYVNGHGYGISGLYTSSNNKTIFKTGGGTYAGDFIATGCTFYVTGTGSKIFDLDNNGNNGAFELNSVNLGTFSATTTSLGEITAYRQLRTGDFAAIGYNDGFTLSGTIQGIALNDSILLNNVAGTTFLQEGTSLSITSGMASDMNALSLDDTSEWCDFDAGNFGTGAVMSLNGFRTGGTNPIPNLDAKNIKALFRSCVGIENTYVGASWELTTETQTAIASANTPIKFAGTTTADLDAHFTMPTNNRLQYNGETPVSVKIDLRANLVSPSTENFNIFIRKYDLSATSFIDIDEENQDTALKISGDRYATSIGMTTTTLDTGDYIEAWVENTNDGGDVTLRETSKLIVSERQA